MKSRLDTLIMISRHPANQRIVQEILLRSAACKLASPVGARALMNGAKSIAALPYALRNVNRDGRVTPRGSSHRSKIEAVGKVISRIVNDVAVESPRPSEKNASTDLFEIVAQRHFSYDEVCAYAKVVEESLHQSLGKEYAVVAVGPHRRGAPFSTSVQLLVTHAECTTRNNAERIYFEKAVKVLSAGLKNTTGMACPYQTVARRLEHHHESAALRVPFDLMSILNEQGSTHERQGAPEDVPTGRLLLHWTPFDLFAVRTLLLTGPLGYSAEFIASCSALGFDMSFIHGLLRCADRSPVHVDTETALYSAVGLPYVHPVNRLES